MMTSAISSALSGILAGEQKLGVRANNLANLTTDGFKASRADQVDISTGGARVASIQKLFSPGALLLTENPLDVAVSGDGFFRLQTPQGERYTRAGAFHVDADGRIVDAGGRILSGGIPLPDGARGVAIGPDGVIQAALADGSVQTLGRIELARFRNPAGLSSEGENTYSATPASGPALYGAPGGGVFGSVTQGALEASNVNLVADVVGEKIDLTQVRANLAVLKTQDDLLKDLLRAKP